MHVNITTAELVSETEKIDYYNLTEAYCMKPFKMIPDANQHGTK